MGANNTQEDFKPRILIYDIETSPIISYNWGIWEQNAIEVIEDWQILCFAYKWLDEKKTHIVFVLNFGFLFVREFCPVSKLQHLQYFLGCRKT